MTSTSTQPATTTAGVAIPCITQDPREPAGPQYLAACTGTADVVSTSRHCPPGECGGHPVCRACYTLARAEGLVQ